MTGDHKNLVALFVVHKLVELALARDAAAEDTEEREIDEGVDEEAAPAWAKAYANANLSGVMERAGDKAAAMATRFYDQLAARASAHVIQGDSLESLAVEFDARFKVVYGKPHVRATAPAPVKVGNKAAAKPKAGLRGNARHRATVSKLCGDPLPCAALPGLVDRLCADRLRQCLPELPPTAGAPPSAAWLAIIAEQGPLTQGHWLLSELRRAAGPEYDGPVCEALAGALSTLLLEAFLSTEFHSYEGSHILLALRVTLAAFTSRPEACAVWDAFVSLEKEGAASGVGASAAVSSAAAGPEANDQLFMVFAELVNCWGMIMSGRWPRALLGEYCSAVEAAHVQSAVEPPSAEDAGGTGASEAAPPPASAVVGMSGSALARVMRGLFPGSRRAVRCAVEEAELDPDVEEDAGSGPESDNFPVQ